MTNLRNDLKVAYQAGNFLQVVYDKSLGEQKNRDDLVDELVSLHNDGLLDVIAGFRVLQNKPDSKINFFLTRRILEKALPHLNAPVRPVMDCVLHLINEAGQDMFAGALSDPFISFCAADASRPKESIAQIEASIDQLVNLLPPTIVAGARIDTEHYFNEAIRLAEHVNIEVHSKKSLPELSNPMVAEAKRLYGSSPERLISVLDPHYMYSISQFSRHLNLPEQGGSGYKPHEWKWLANLLIEAAEINTATILPQIVQLIFKDDMGISGFICGFDSKFATELFDKRLQEVMCLIAKEFDYNMFDKREQDLIRYAQKYASDWLNKTVKKKAVARKKPAAKKKPAARKKPTAKKKEKK